MARLIDLKPNAFACVQDGGSVTLLRKHLCLLLPYAAETFGRSTVLLEESSLDKSVISKLHSKDGVFSQRLLQKLQ